MVLRDRIAYLRKEHRELLQVAEKIESTLALGSKADFPEHQRCINELRRLEHGLRGIEEHCHAEERAVESTYHHYASVAERRLLDAEHMEIARRLSDFREELRFATADRTEPLPGPGMDLVTKLRSHIAHEERLLQAIGKSEARRRRVNKSKRPQPAAAKIRASGTKKKERASKEISYIPYTMEPHPEL